MTTTMRDRAIEFASAMSRNPETFARQVQEFAESEVSLALQPREASPELAEAERRLRNDGKGTDGFRWRDGPAIADELDRLRCELARKSSVLRELMRLLGDPLHVRFEDGLCDGGCTECDALRVAIAAARAEEKG